MCLISLAWQLHPDYPLVLLANRDEFYDRPTAHLQYWEDHPQLLAGRDLQQGGTWLGLSRQGRLAAVTNFRNGQREQDKRSRGDLTRSFLCSALPAEDWIQRHQAEFDQYGGFNLLLGDSQGLWYCSNRTPGYRKLEPGIYGMSNALLDTPWPKLQQLKQRLGEAIAHGALEEDQLLQMMRNEQTFADQLLPDTGISLPWERSLSACFIRLENYGTRASSLVTQSSSGQVRFIEQRFDASGSAGRSAIELQGFTLGSDTLCDQSNLSPALLGG
ncbi:NRDE family protein [Marinobacterium jannaschii]|uniref:NRDE family protein n=1 Tax=Marinobacterium jannaschii TaxID=64970 RepID=UPI000A06F564|nr:NRDE family protein [Marinobacterium jannaschii]